MLPALSNPAKAPTAITPLRAHRPGNRQHGHLTTRHLLSRIMQHLVSLRTIIYGLQNPDMVTNSDLAATARQPPLHLPPIQPGDSSYDQYYPNSATAHLNAVFGREAKSPRNTRPLHTTGTADMPRGPVPKFKALDATHDLQPRINPQPAYRRANPEGGFISVCSLSKWTWAMPLTLIF